jgi:lycopene beta-cyclase
VTRRDVAVVGDGPAGLALAAAARVAGLDVAVVGTGRPWTATYGVWRDDVAALPDACFGHVLEGIAVHGHRHHDVRRAYGILDNDALRAHLGRGLDVVATPAERIRHMAWGTRVVTAGGDIDARIVVDARGRTTDAQTAQTAYGIVVAAPPAGGAVLMDLRPAGVGPPTFAYVVPVTDGWLVEETVLAARPPVPAASLARRLATRVGRPPSRRTELVKIAMGGPLPRHHGPVPQLGAAAGYTHPATGFSVGASLRAAPRVAAALATVCRTSDRPDARPVWDAVWPRSLRITRRLHDHGLRVLLGLDQDELATFFDAFFDLPVDVWAPYLRIDATPRQVSRTMTALARRLPLSLRPRLLAGPRRRGS